MNMVKFLYTNLNAFCKSAKFATFPGLAVDDALAVEVANEDLVVLGLDRPPEESPTTWANLAAVGSVFAGWLTADLNEISLRPIL